MRCRGRNVAVKTGVKEGARACVRLCARVWGGCARTPAPWARTPALNGVGWGLGGPFRRRPHGRACYGTAAHRRVRLAWMILYMPHV